MKKHLLSDYPPRTTACGLYYPSELFTKGFGTYTNEGITCGNCQKTIKLDGEGKKRSNG